MRFTFGRYFLLTAVFGASAFGQSFNIDFGQPEDGPPASYGGAGLAGFWNSLPLPHTSASSGPSPFDVFLRDLDGNLTSVRLHQFGGTEIIEATFFGPNQPTGNHATLLKDALITHSIPIKNCLFFNGLENGFYDVITYAFVPNHPEVTNIVFHDFTPGTVNVTGAWPGQHVEGVTYARHTVEVTNGFMGPHAGLPAGGNTTIGSALNGIQLRRIVPVETPIVSAFGFLLFALGLGIVGGWVLHVRRAGSLISGSAVLG